MAALYQGYRTLAMEPDELITSIHLPLAHPDDITHFRKVGTRLAQAISKVVLAVRLRRAAGLVSEARVAFGSVAAMPIRCPAVESALVGGPVDPGVAGRIGRDISPIDDIRSTAQYRMAVAERTLRSALAGMR